jgi:integrase/recombinase XerC
LFGLAMRRAEVVGLDPADVDFPTATLLVTRKGKREREQLSIPEPTVLALESWLAARGVEPGPLFTGVGPHNPGGRLTGNGLGPAVSRRVRDAKLARGLWPHAFRHAAATVAAERTEKDFEVMAFTGHAKPQTAGRYLDRKRESQARVARLVAKDLKL